MNERRRIDRAAAAEHHGGMKSHGGEFMRVFHSALLIATLAFSGCLAVHSESITPVERSSGPNTTLDRLYFGRDIHGSGQVSEAQWAAFLAEVVTTRFPAGLTVWRSEGQWRDKTGMIVHEPGFVLELLDPGDAASDRAVTEIIAEYKRRFEQEAVLRMRSRVDAQFLD